MVSINDSHGLSRRTSKLIGKIESEVVIDLSIMVINEGSTSHSMTGASWYLIMWGNTQWWWIVG